MLALSISSAILVLFCTKVCCDGCDEGDIRLVGGWTMFEGRVEVCSGGVWGTVCDDYWDVRDATVVCRQLGFPLIRSCNRACFGEGYDLPIILDDVHCEGDEERLVDCPASTEHNCRHYEDAGVECQPTPAPQILTTTYTATSVHVEWQVSSNTPAPNSYSITITNSDSALLGINYTIIIELPGRASVHPLLPNHQYNICVVGIFGPQTSLSACQSFRTPNLSVSQSLINPSGTVSPTPINPFSTVSPTLPVSAPPVSLTLSSTVSPTPPVSPTPVESMQEEYFTALTGGILGFIIIILFILLVVAGMGLTYSRCRSRIKDKHLSSVELGDNPAYIVRPRVSSGNRGVEDDPNYETVQNIASCHVTGHVGVPRNHVPADITQHYEVQDPTIYYEVP